ncbi:MAG: TolC family protein [Candidatus Hydrogenedentes bacterium]|nr:TolC family protein [Candidatus Hydrogenedentota bacterium]
MRPNHISSFFIVCFAWAAPFGVHAVAEEPVSNTDEVNAGTATSEPIEVAGRALSLGDALTLALEKSPRLTAFSWDVRAADARILQAGLRPNPELSVEVEEVRWTSGPSAQTQTTTFSGALERSSVSIPQGQGQDPLEIPTLKTNPVLGWERESEEGTHSGFSEAEITVTLAYMIELGAKRAKRTDVAEREKATLLWDYETARADVLADAARAFVGALAAQENLALQNELVQLAEEAANTTERRVSAGAASPLENNRAEIALATTRVAQDQAVRELVAAYARLASTWGDTEVTFDSVTGTLEGVGEVPTLDSVRAEIVSNPDIARWAAEVALREARFRNERAQRISNLTVQLGFRSTGLADRSVSRYGFDTGGGIGYSHTDTSFDADRDNSLVLGFSLPLPIFDRNQGNIAAAEYMVSKTSDERRAVEASVWVLLAEAREAAAAAADEVNTLTADVMPKAEETFAKTQRGYEQGKFGYLDVLDAQRTLFDVRTSHLDALARYNAAVVDIERLTGRALQTWTKNEGLPLEENENAQ